MDCPFNSIFIYASRPGVQQWSGPTRAEPECRGRTRPAVHKLSPAPKLRLLLQPGPARLRPCPVQLLRRPHRSQLQPRPALLIHHLPARGSTQLHPQVYRQRTYTTSLKGHEIFIPPTFLSSQNCPTCIWALH